MPENKIPPNVESSLATISTTLKYIQRDITNQNMVISDQTIKIENIHTKISNERNKADIKRATEREVAEKKFVTRKEVIAWAIGIGGAITYIKEVLIGK